MASKNNFSRRDFLKVGSLFGSGLAISFYFPFGNKLMGIQENRFKPNSFINVLSDGRIILSVAKAEMGQGVWTSLPMLIAEEMDADWEKVEIIQSSDSIFTGTGGTGSITRNGWKKLRKAGAIPKYMIL